VGQRGHPALGHGVRFEIDDDDRNGCGRFRHSLRGVGVGREDDIDARGDELAGDLPVLLDLVLSRGSDIDDETFPEDVTEVAEPLGEGLEGRRLLASTAAKPADSRVFRDRLSAGGRGADTRPAMIAAMKARRPAAWPAVGLKTLFGARTRSPRW
jgi:hypothetical protein